jgi:proline iminopeptidase
MIADAEEMAVWSRKQLGHEKIFVTGHSWGSFLGLELAKRHPGWLHAYIGVGQMTDMPESERRGWTFAMDAAKAAENAKAIRALNSIAPYSPPGRLIPLQDIYTQRRWVEFYGGTMAYRHGDQAEGDLADLGLAGLHRRRGRKDLGRQRVWRTLPLPGAPWASIWRPPEDSNARY